MEREERRRIMLYVTPALVSAAVYIYFRLHMEFRSRALTLTSCLRIDIITWHSSQARVPRSYQLFILEHGASRRILDLRSRRRRPTTALTARRRDC